MKKSLVWTILLAGPLLAQPAPLPAPPDIDIPTVQPAPLPPPPPVAPSTPIVLPSDTFFIITSDAPFLAASSPDGLVSITHETGPLKIRGKFVDNLGKISTRTFTRKYIVSVEAVKSGQCELLIWPTGATDEKAIQRRAVDVQVGPVPEPGPGPNPPPTPTPIPADAFRVLFVYETSALTPTQSNVMNAAAVRAYLDSRCALDPDGKTRGRRWYDKDVDISHDAPIWQQIWAAAKPMLGPLPQVVVFNGTKGTAFPLPATADELLALLKKYGG